MINNTQINWATIRRPASLSGTTVVSDRSDVEMPKKLVPRAIQGHTIVRKAFKNSKIQARHGLSFDRMRAIDISKHGVKVQLTKKTTGKLKVLVDDATDKLWLAEKARREALGETKEEIMEKPPLDRPIRQLEITAQLNDFSLTTQQHLDVLEQASSKGAFQSEEGKAFLAQTVERIIDNPTVPLRAADWFSIKNLVNEMDIPDDFRDMGIEEGVINEDEFLENSGFYSIWLLSRIIGPTGSLQVAFTEDGDLVNILEMPRAMMGSSLDLQDSQLYVESSRGPKGPPESENEPAIPVPIVGETKTQNETSEEESRRLIKNAKAREVRSSLLTPRERQSLKDARRVASGEVSVAKLRELQLRREAYAARRGF